MADVVRLSQGPAASTASGSRLATAPRSVHGTFPLGYTTGILGHAPLPADSGGSAGSQLVGAGVRIGRHYGVAASVDRAPEFTLMRAGFFIGW